MLTNYAILMASKQDFAPAQEILIKHLEPQTISAEYRHETPEPSKKFNELTTQHAVIP